MEVNIEGLSRAAVLAVLYNQSRQQGMGLMHGPAPVMTEQEAEKLLEKGSYFDYVHGKVMKISLPQGTKTVDTFLYDRDLGQGAGEKAIQILRK